MYKALLRPYIDYGDLIFDQTSNESFCKKLESVQYKAALTITGTIQDTSREKVFMGLGLESLKSRRWLKYLCCMDKIMKNQTPEYLNNLIPKRKQSFNSRNIYIPSYNCRTKYFTSSFSPASLEEWFHLDPSIRNAETTNALKQKLLLFIYPLENSIFNIFDPKGLKLLTCLLLSFSHRQEHRFQHDFQECLNPSCPCSQETENTSIYCTA